MEVVITREEEIGEAHGPDGQAPDREAACERLALADCCRDVRAHRHLVR